MLRHVCPCVSPIEVVYSWKIQSRRANQSCNERILDRIFLYLHQHVLTEVNYVTKLYGFVDADKSRPLIHHNFKVVNLNRSMFVVLII
jgi:hypothetical protein